MRRLLLIIIVLVLVAVLVYWGQLQLIDTSTEDSRRMGSEVIKRGEGVMVTRALEKTDAAQKGLFAVIRPC